MTGKLDEHGLLTDEVIIENIDLEETRRYDANGYSVTTIDVLPLLILQRNELLELFEEWIEADDDGFRMADRLRDRMIVLRTNYKTPSG